MMTHVFWHAARLLFSRIICAARLAQHGLLVTASTGQRKKTTMSSKEDPPDDNHQPTNSGDSLPQQHSGSQEDGKGRAGVHQRQQQQNAPRPAVYTPSVDHAQLALDFGKTAYGEVKNIARGEDMYGGLTAKERADFAGLKAIEARVRLAKDSVVFFLLDITLVNATDACSVHNSSRSTRYGSYSGRHTSLQSSQACRLSLQLK